MLPVHYVHVQRALDLIYRAADVEKNAVGVGGGDAEAFAHKERRQRVVVILCRTEALGKLG
jgi:hypothetical protein